MCSGNWRWGSGHKALVCPGKGFGLNLVDGEPLKGFNESVYTVIQITRTA